jgi:hypothetical protein
MFPKIPQLPAVTPQDMLHMFFISNERRENLAIGRE